MTSWRRTLCASAGASVLLLSGACGTSDQPGPASTRKSCDGGQVRFLQGQPADLPGGGTAGIGQVFEDRDPPAFNLAVGTGSYDRDATRPLSVGDTFGVEGTTYRVACISRSVVTVDRAR